LYFKVYITGGSIANTEIDAVEVIDLDLQTIDSLKNWGESIEKRKEEEESRLDINVWCSVTRPNFAWPNFLINRIFVQTFCGLTFGWPNLSALNI